MFIVLAIKKEEMKRKADKVKTTDRDMKRKLIMDETTPMKR